ncbi:Alpha/Beta hydrolase protein [Coprinopsis sp. MPI-PUGE-AT-0042]|nr:Alpha/Beta hydrolase protein [Coprinopsis sp. MPI-PUGE-AT-0042]
MYIREHAFRISEAVASQLSFKISLFIGEFHSRSKPPKNAQTHAPSQRIGQLPLAKRRVSGFPPSKEDSAREEINSSSQHSSPQLDFERLPPAQKVHTIPSLELENRVVLKDAPVACTTWGKLKETNASVINIRHALTGHAQANLSDRNKALDPNRFVILWVRCTGASVRFYFARDGPNYYRQTIWDQVSTFNGLRRCQSSSATPWEVLPSSTSNGHHFNANCYIRITRKLDTHDIARGRVHSSSTYFDEDSPDALNEVLARVPPRALVISIATDSLFTPLKQKTIADAIPDATLATIESPDEHDGFLFEFEEINRHVLEFLRREFRGCMRRTKRREVWWRKEEKGLRSVMHDKQCGEREEVSLPLFKAGVQPSTFN